MNEQKATKGKGIPTQRKGNPSGKTKGKGHTPPKSSASTAIEAQTPTLPIDAPALQTNAPLAILPAPPSPRIGKDEMNLVEKPWATLQFRQRGEKVIERKWDIWHPQQKKYVPALWRVAGDPKMGLPGPQDERVYLVLMELTREQGMPQTVAFSQHKLLQKLGWPANSHYYRLLKDCFMRLKAVNITAENAFWDAQTKSFSTVGFSIIYDYKLTDEPRGRKSQGQTPASWFQWSNWIYHSMCNSYIRSINLDIALSLDHPVALRLYRYLDKQRYRHPESFVIGLRLLCENRLGLTDTPYASKLKERLEPAHEELKRVGFLQHYEYQAMKTTRGRKKQGSDAAEEKVVYVFTPMLPFETDGGMPAGEEVVDENAESPGEPPTAEEIDAVKAAFKGGATKGKRSTKGRGGEMDSVADLLQGATGKSGSGGEDRGLGAAARDVYDTLPEDEQKRLREIALRQVPPWMQDGWMRLDRPTSYCLWNLVQQHYPEQVQAARKQETRKPEKLAKGKTSNK